MSNETEFQNMKKIADAEMAKAKEAFEAMTPEQQAQLKLNAQRLEKKTLSSVVR